MAPALVSVIALALAAAPASAFRDRHHPDPAKRLKAGKRLGHPVARTSAFSSAFATTWPCSETSAERPPVPISNAPQVKVIYAYPTDTGDQFASYASLIQSDAQAIRDRLANEAGSSKTIRFDTGATGGTCGTNPERYLDIQSIALSHDSAFYNAGTTFTTLTNELKTKVAPVAAGARVNYLVYADRIRATGASGEASILVDDEKSLESAINQGQQGDGRLFALVYGDPITAQPDFNGLGTEARKETFLHELSHNLGAVQDSAPHSSHAGHCLDERDIMCYQDTSGIAPTVVCNVGVDFQFSEPYDCNNDDYYNTAPAAGSYLAQKWDTYDSVFLCNLTDCDVPPVMPGPATVSAGTTNGRLTLTASVPGATIAHYEWDLDGDNFYDEDTGSASSIVPTFKFAGTGTIHMRASQADGTFSLGTFTLTRPVPHLTVSGKFAVGQTVALDGSATEDPDGQITDFRWDLDNDGGFETDTGTSRTVSTTLQRAGPTTFAMAIDYGWGASFAQTAPITVAPALTGGTGPGQTPSVTPNGLTSAPPVLSLSNVSLKILLAHGLPVSLKCGASCIVNMTMTVSAKTARKLKLNKKARKPVRIGSLTGQLAPGVSKLSLKLNPVAKVILKRARTLPAQVTGTVTQGTATPLRISKAFVFKR